MQWTRLDPMKLIIWLEHFKQRKEVIIGQETHAPWQDLLWGQKRASTERIFSQNCSWILELKEFWIHLPARYSKKPLTMHSVIYSAVSYWVQHTLLSSRNQLTWESSPVLVQRQHQTDGFSLVVLQQSKLLFTVVAITIGFKMKHSVNSSSHP